MIEPELRLPIHTLILCDCQSLYFGAQKTCGQGKRTDFKRLKEMLAGRIAEADAVEGDPVRSILEWRAYVFSFAIGRDAAGEIVYRDTSRMRSMLSHFGWNVTDRLAMAPIYLDAFRASATERATERGRPPGLADPGQADWTDTIVTDSANGIEQFHRFVFVTGSEGVRTQVDHLREVGKRVWIAAYKSHMETSLAHIQADARIELGESMTMVHPVAPRPQ